MARVTGLEPATSGVTGRHSNRLSYTRASLVKGLKPLSRGGLDRFGERLTRRFGTGCQARSRTKERRPTCLCHAIPATLANGQKNQILSECLLRFRPDPHRSRPPTRRTCFRDAKGRLAQLVERLVYTEDVGSSSLSSPTILPFKIR